MPDNSLPKKAINTHTRGSVGAGSRGYLTACQTTLFLLLGILILVILAGGLGFVSLQEGYWRFIPEIDTFPQLEQPVLEATVVLFQMPPTWTPRPSPIATAIPEAVEPHPDQPASILPETLKPVASITPLSNQWRITIGRSVQNRPIEVFRFGVGKKERMIVAGIHGGNEWNTIALADELIEHLILHPEVLPPEVTLYILRSLNPDGEAAGRSADSRANANGVDLNRNFDVNWKSSWITKGCWSERPISAGSAPGSELETQALMKFLLARHVEALISYHSAGLGIFPGGDPPDPESVLLAMTISQMSGYPYPPVETGCEYTGTLADWAAQHGIAAVDLELLDHIHTDLDKNLKVLTVLFHW